MPGKEPGARRGVRERRRDAYLVTWPQVSSCPRGTAPRSTRGCAGVLRRPGRPPNRAWASRCCARCWSPGPTEPPGSWVRPERPWWARGARAPAAAAALPAPPPLPGRARLASRAAALACDPAAADADAAAKEPPAHPSPGRRLRRLQPRVPAPVPGQWLRRPRQQLPRGMSAPRRPRLHPPAPAPPPRPPPLQPRAHWPGRPTGSRGGRPAGPWLAHTLARTHSPRTHCHFLALTRLHLVPYTYFHSSSIADSRQVQAQDPPKRTPSTHTIPLLST